MKRSNKMRVMKYAAILVSLMLGISPSLYAAAPSLETMQQEIEELKKERAADKQEIQELKSKVGEFRSDLGERKVEKTNEHKELEEFGTSYRNEGLLKAGGLKIGTYGEMLWRKRERSVSAFDPRRVVLLPSYAINDWMVFNSEIEIEHGGAGVDFTTDGNVEVEQAYVDFLFQEHFNWRSLGLDLIPMGRINLYHEPTVFYSTDRPELYSEVIPSTWTEMGTSFFGKIVDGLQYQVMLSEGLEDRAGKMIDGNNGLRSARPSVGEDFNQQNGTPGFTTRLAYQPPFIPGLDGSTSWHWSEASTATSALNINVFDTELRYFVPKTGIELRADYAISLIGDNSRLLANNDGDPTNNVGTHLWGTYFEIAYHFWPDELKTGHWKQVDMVPFFRYTHLDLQAGPSEGTDVTASNGGNDRDIYTFGFAFFPVKEVVLKLDYRVVDDNRTSGAPNGAEQNQLQFATGWFF